MGREGDKLQCRETVFNQECLPVRIIWGRFYKIHFFWAPLCTYWTLGWDILRKAQWMILRHFTGFDVSTSGKSIDQAVRFCWAPACTLTPGKARFSISLWASVSSSLKRIGLGGLYAAFKQQPFMILKTTLLKYFSNWCLSVFFLFLEAGNSASVSLREEWVLRKPSIAVHTPEALSVCRTMFRSLGSVVCLSWEGSKAVALNLVPGINWMM